ncbi:hypothetical protein ACFPRL_08975 [Pseudoclavibacter helvolus]
MFKLGQAHDPPRFRWPLGHRTDASTLATGVWPDPQQARNGGRRAAAHTPTCAGFTRCARISELPKRSHRLAA